MFLVSTNRDEIRVQLRRELGKTASCVPSTDAEAAARRSDLSLQIHQTPFGEFPLVGYTMV